MAARLGNEKRGWLKQGRGTSDNILSLHVEETHKHANPRRNGTATCHQSHRQSLVLNLMHGKAEFRVLALSISSCDGDLDTTLSRIGLTRQVVQIAAEADASTQPARGRFSGAGTACTSGPFTFDFVLIFFASFAFAWKMVGSPEVRRRFVCGAGVWGGWGLGILDSGVGASGYHGVFCRTEIPQNKYRSCKEKAREVGSLEEKEVPVARRFQALPRAAPLRRRVRF